MHYSAKRGLAIACRLSVRLSVSDVVGLCDIGWNSSKVISLTVSLRCSLSPDPNIMCLLYNQHPEMLAETGGYERSGFRRTQAVISLKRSEIE